jgi:hypothetical protein
MKMKVVQVASVCHRFLRRAAISTWKASGASRRVPSDAVASPVAKRLHHLKVQCNRFGVEGIGGGLPVCLTGPSYGTVMT